jgi:hypothetical protein
VKYRVQDVEKKKHQENYHFSLMEPGHQKAILPLQNHREDAVHVHRDTAAHVPIEGGRLENKYESYHKIGSL